MQTLHILNGEEMKKAFHHKGHLEGEPVIPFNEAMCAGETCETIFSEAFIKIRALTHGVSENDYRRITIENLEEVFHEERDHLKLWFDEDMFCQINLLTLLAWFDQIGYEGKVELCLVSPQFEPLASYPIKVSGYHSVYKQVLIHREFPTRVTLPPLKKGIHLYFQYKDENGELVRFIQDHPDVREGKLVELMIGTFQTFGLGDVQYLQLIRSVRNAKQ